MDILPPPAPGDGSPSPGVAPSPDAAPVLEVRGLTRTCREQARQNEPFPAARPELLRAAHWRAARQRRAFERAGRMEDVVDAIVAETARGIA